MARIFVSHSSRDNEVAAEIKRWLEARGFDQVFLDIDKHAGIPVGSQWERELYRKISSSQAVILVVTSNWHDSKWCFVEFAQARALGKAIFPVIVAPGGERLVAPDIQQLDLRLDREGGLEHLAKELWTLAVNAQGGFEWDPARPPYPGLLAFEKEDAAVFFGRDDDVRRLIERLNAERVNGGARMVSFLGASGSGKSSVIRAGVLPRLERDKRNWIVLPPFRPRRDPATEFARVASYALDAPQNWTAWRDKFASPDAERELEVFAELLRQRADAREAHVLVTVDQGEELFSVAEPQQAARFFELLRHLSSEHVPFVLLFALRSDYLGRLQEAAEGLPFQEHSLGPFPSARVREIIEGPAGVAGFQVEEGLVVHALADMAVGDALPLLAFTLRELYDRYGGRPPGAAPGPVELSLAHYRELGDVANNVSPLENAVRRRADEVIDALAPADLDALREAFVGHLVRVDDEGQYVRRPAIWNDLPERARPILEQLAQARLLVIRTTDSVTTVEAAHEALLRKWPRLTAWLDAERDFIIGRKQLGEALLEWQRAPMPQKDAALLRGLRLSRAREWLNDHRYALGEAEQRYIEASIASDAAEQHRNSRRRWIAASSAVAALGLGLVAALFFYESDVANKRAKAAALAVEARAWLSQGRSIEALAPAARATEIGPSSETRSVLLESVLAVSPHLERILPAPGLKPSSLAWSASADMLAVGGWGSLITWRLSTGERSEIILDEKPKLESMRAPVLALGWRDRNLVAALGDGRLVSGQPPTELRTQRLLENGELRQAALGDAGEVLAARLDEPEVAIFRCTSACERKSLAAGYATAVALDSARSRAAVALEDGRVEIISPGNDTIEMEPRADAASRIAALAWSSDGRHLAVGTTAGQLIIVNGDGKREVVTTVGGSVSAVAWDPQSARLAATCDASAICVWSLSPANGKLAQLRRLARLTSHTQTVAALAWAPDGSRLASAADDVRLWSVDRPDRATFTLDAGAAVALTDLDVAADRKWLAAGDDQGNVRLWGLPSLRPQRPLPSEEPSEIKAVAWSPRAPLIAVADGAARVAIHHWPDDGKPRHISPRPDEIVALRWMPDGGAVITAGSLDGAIAITPVGGGETQMLNPMHVDAVAALAVSADGSRLLSADTKGNVWAWNIATRARLDAPRLETGAGRGTLNFSHDGRRLLAAGNDADVLVYANAQDGKPIRCHSGSTMLDDAVFAADDAAVYAVGGDAEPVLYMWSLSDSCDLHAAAHLPLPHDRAQSAPASLKQRRHLVVLPELDALAVTLSVREIRFIALDPKTWLARAHQFE
jgi:WD40 repeat protein